MSFWDGTIPEECAVYDIALGMSCSRIYCLHSQVSIIAEQCFIGGGELKLCNHYFTFRQATIGQNYELFENFPEMCSGQNEHMIDHGSVCTLKLCAFSVAGNKHVFS